MTTATPAQRRFTAPSLTKAVSGFGLQPMLQQCRPSIWVSKPTSAGCLA